MKRLICIVLTALMLLTSAALAEGAEEALTEVLTMRQVMEANASEKLMEHYERVHILVKSGKEMWERYMGPEGYYYNDGTTSELYQGALCYSGERGRFTAALHAGVEIDKSAFDYIFFGEEYIDMEEILYQYVEGDVMQLKTQLHLSDVNPGMVEPGNYLVVEYALDAETLAVMDLREKLRFENGQSLMTDAEITITYGAEMPDGMQEMLNRLEQEENKTVSVVLNPGDAEEAVSVRLPAGDTVEVIAPEGYALYADREGRKAWKASKIKGDTEICVLPKK